MAADEKPGAALVRLRWEKATAEERAKQAALMNDARWAAHRARLAAEGKTVSPRKRPKTRRPDSILTDSVIPDSGEGIRPRRRRKPRAK